MFATTGYPVDTVPIGKDVYVQFGRVGQDVKYKGRIDWLAFLNDKLIDDEAVSIEVSIVQGVIVDIDYP